jgi:hypothetical protein
MINILKRIINYKVLFIICLIFSLQITESQILSKYGIKSGLLWTGLTAPNSTNAFGNFSPSLFNFISVDFGIYAEIFNKERFCISTELHYVTKGEDPADNFQYPVQIDPNRGEVYNFTNISNRFHYISLQLLPRYRFGLTQDDKVYFLLGPHFDYMIGNSYSEDNNEFKVKNSKLELGVTSGIGGEVRDKINFEFRFEYNLTGTYKLKYGNESVSRHNISLIFMAGVCLKNLSKKLYLILSMIWILPLILSL